MTPYEVQSHTLNGTVLNSGIFILSFGLSYYCKDQYEENSLIVVQSANVLQKCEQGSLHTEVL